MAKRTQRRPTYSYERTDRDGIRERLALASLVYSKNNGWLKSVRFISKTEGWEANFNWTDDYNRVNLNSPGVKRGIALAIEGARAAWYDAKYPSKELLAIMAQSISRKVA